MCNSGLNLGEGEGGESGIRSVYGAKLDSRCLCMHIPRVYAKLVGLGGGLIQHVDIFWHNVILLRTQHTVVVGCMVTRLLRSDSFLVQLTDNSLRHYNYSSTKMSIKLILMRGSSFIFPFWLIRH